MPAVDVGGARPETEDPHVHAGEGIEQAAVAYFERLRGRFASASRRMGGHEEHRLGIGGANVCLRLTGPPLADVLLPALITVAGPAPAGPADFEIEAWDGASSGVDVPPAPWSLRDVIARGDVRPLSDGRVRAQVDSGHGTLFMWDAGQRRGLMWTSDARQLPYWVHAAPLRSLLHWGLAGATRHLLHAAAVGDERAGALLVGPSGSGKTTTALACLLAGIGYVADDYVVAETEPLPRALALYGTAKVHEASLALLPQLAALRTGSIPGPKAVVDVARARPELVQRSTAIRAIVLPRVATGRLSLRPVSGAEALRALAPSTILQHGQESHSGMAVMSELVRRVPAYALALGSDVSAIAPAIGTLLEGLA